MQANAPCHATLAAEHLGDLRESGFSGIVCEGEGRIQTLAVVLAESRDEKNSFFD